MREPWEEADLYWSRKELEAQRLPVCAVCECRLWAYYTEIDGETICDDCLLGWLTDNGYRHVYEEE